MSVTEIIDGSERTMRWEDFVSTVLRNRNLTLEIVTLQGKLDREEVKKNQAVEPGSTPVYIVDANYFS